MKCSKLDVLGFVKKKYIWQMYIRTVVLIPMILFSLCACTTAKQTASSKSNAERTVVKNGTTGKLQVGGKEIQVADSVKRIELRTTNNGIITSE